MTTTPVLSAETARPYHHGDLRHTLMEAACHHIAEEGTEKLSLRALAREAGVSPTAPYRHFATKNALLAAIAAEGFEELYDQVSQYIEHSGTDVTARLRACGHAYVDYALSQPVKYHLMFGDILADFTEFADLQASADRTFDRFLVEVQHAQQQGKGTDASFEAVAAYLWASMHGIASLIISKRKRMAVEEQSKSVNVVRYLRSHLEETIARVIQGL